MTMNQSSPPLFTIFTPTYNRANTLPRVYESLLKQTFQNFEWLIIDDGSKDETQTLIQKWQADSPFPIRYLYQENQGKHIAFNRAVKEARGELFSPLDSDDACVPNALERLKQLWDEIPDKQRFTGVCVLCKDQEGRLVGKPFPQQKMDSDSCEMLYKYGLKGEKWGFHRTEVLREYPFPEIKKLKFIPESIIWHAIAKKYKIRFVNEILRIYYINDMNSVQNRTLEQNTLQDKTFEEKAFQEKNFQEKTLTASLSETHSRQARLIFYRWVLNNDINWIWNNPFAFLKYAFQYVRFSNEPIHVMFNVIYPSVSRILIMIIWLPAAIVRFCERFFYAKQSPR